MKRYYKLVCILTVLNVFISACVRPANNGPLTVSPTPQDELGSTFNCIVTDLSFTNSDNLIYVVFINEDNRIGGTGVINVPAGTPIFIDELGTLSPFRMEEIVIGQKLIVNGSYVTEGVPMVTKATKIVFLDRGPQASLTPLQTRIQADIEGVITEIAESEDANFSGYNLTIDGFCPREDVEGQFESITVTQRTLVWSEEDTGYYVRDLEFLKTGQTVTILLEEGYSRVIEGSQLIGRSYNPVLEIIVGSE